jgi:hypothetical protein
MLIYDLKTKACCCCCAGIVSKQARTIDAFSAAAKRLPENLAPSSRHPTADSIAHLAPVSVVEHVCKARGPAADRAIGSRRAAVAAK